MEIEMEFTAAIDSIMGSNDCIRSIYILSRMVCYSVGKGMGREATERLL